MLPMLPSRRRVLAGSVSVLLTGCGGMVQGLAPTYRTTKSGSRMLAFQTEAFARGFAGSHAQQWEATLKKVDEDAAPLLRAVKERGVRLEILVKPYVPERADPDIETYAIDLSLAPKADPKAKTKAEPVIIEGRAGTKEAAYDAEAARVGKATGLEPALVRRGHFALYAMLNLMTALNASTVTLQRHAFKLLVVREKVRAGEKADWFDPNRPAKETEADVADALAIIADHRDFVNGLRGEVLALAALAGRHRDDGAIDELVKRAAAFREGAAAWRAAHPPMMMEELETRVKAFAASPTAMLDELEEKLGFVTAAAQIAKGVLTGSPGEALEGIAKLAPKDSSTRIALEGFAAAARGDLVKAADAALTLAGSSTKASEVKDTFATAKRLAKTP